MGWISVCGYEVKRVEVKVALPSTRGDCFFTMVYDRYIILIHCILLQIAALLSLDPFFLSFQ